MIEEEGKCRAEAEARGLPEDKEGQRKDPAVKESEKNNTEMGQLYIHTQYINTRKCNILWT